MATVFFFSSFYVILFPSGNSEHSREQAAREGVSVDQPCRAVPSYEERDWDMMAIGFFLFTDPVLIEELSSIHSLIRLWMRPET